MEEGFFDILKKFFWPKEQVHKHWYASVAGFQFESDLFYQRIEQELESRKVPGLQVARVEFSEGGMLSAKREYLRLSRERIVLDICAAPFGTGYFFSFRLVELPLGVKPLEMVVFLVGLSVLFALLTNLLGTITGFIVLIALLGLSVLFLGNVLAMGLKDVDAFLLKTPVISPIYEIFFRKETYYREDTRLMYWSTVNEITKTLVDEVTLAKGIKLVKRYERRPILGELYAETTSTSEDAQPQPQ